MNRLPLFAVCLTALVAEAVPPTMPFSGRLATSAGVVNGPVAVTFKLFDVATGGTALWTETHSALTASNGLVFAELGAHTTLDPAVFAGPPRWLEVTVEAETLSPRLKLASVPYAFRADTAEHLGALAEGDVQRQLQAGAGLSLSGTTLSLSSTGCLSNSVWTWDGASFSCTPLPAAASFTGAAGITVTGSTIGLSTQGCVAGESWRYTGTTWDCLPNPTTTDASQLVTGTLSTDRYSAAADLAVEGYLDGNAATDLMSRAQGDARWLSLTGGTVAGALTASSTVSAPAFAFTSARASVLSLPGFALSGTGWIFHVGFGEVYPQTAGAGTFGAIPVNLPQGATVTALSCVVSDNDALNHITVDLRRITNSTDVQMALIATPFADSVTGWQTISDTTVIYPVIDNTGSSYYLEVYARFTTGTFVALRRCWVNYTTTTVPY